MINCSFDSQEKLNEHLKLFMNHEAVKAQHYLKNIKLILTKSKGVFHQPLGLKNTVLRGSRGRPGEWLRQEYSFGDQYRIRVVQERFLQISILHAFVKITQLQRSRQPSREKAWYSQILTKSKGVFHQPLGFKNTILRESRGRPGEWSRPEYSSGDQYRIRVVQESFLQISILHGL